MRPESQGTRREEVAAVVEEGVVEEVVVDTTPTFGSSITTRRYLRLLRKLRQPQPQPPILPVPILQNPWSLLLRPLSQRRNPRTPCAAIEA
jgi:hypothetical protein